ncbi:MAG: T9SS type A sorting domain-containing protein [Bacteroidia bacterium]|nr:T9SS type A sorting domain-containing protein [Bacteroidia bacterium]
MKTVIIIISIMFLSIGMWAQKIYTIAGDGSVYFTGDSVLATNAGLTPYGSVAFDQSGNIYFADIFSHRIRKVDALTGMISTVAGTGIGGYNGDGILAKSAQIYTPNALALDENGNIYIADYSNNRVRKVDAVTGLISTVAGTGVWGYSGDSLLATTSMVKNVTGITVDNIGNVYFSDMGNERIRKIDASNGFLYDIAGNGINGYNGDNILADHAMLSGPHGIALDASNNLYIADKENDRIRKVNAVTGIITTVAGTGVYDIYNGDGILAINANFRHPNSVAVNAVGDIFISDQFNQMIFKVNHTNNRIYTVAGTLSGGSTAEGISALTALLPMPVGVAIDACGNIYISLYDSHRVRKVFSYDLNLNQTDLTCFGQCNGAISVNATGGVAPYSYLWGNGMGNSTSLSNLCAGTYWLSVVDNSGCKEILNITITQPNQMASNLTTVNTNCNATGSANVSVSGNYPMTYLWSNGSTTTSATGLSAGTYSITITDAVQCTYVENFTITNTTVTFPSAPICMVTVDSLSQNNIIVWDKNGFQNADSFIVYREIATNNYQPIAHIPLNGFSQFVDTVRTLYFPNTGDPNAGTYRYKLQIIDSCGRVSNMSPYHNTIYMLNNGSGIFYWTQPYTIQNGPNPVSSYELMRDDNSNGTWHVVASVAGTQQTVSDPLYVIYQNTASWRVRTVWSVNCTPSVKGTNSNFSTSFSNIYSNNATSIINTLLENQIFVFPNPTNDKVYIQSNLHTIEGVEIFNVFGELVSSCNKSSIEENGFIDLSNISSGIYFINITTADGFAVKKIIKNK